MDAEGAQDDIPVGEAAGVNDPSDIPWRTTAWSAGGEDVGSVKAATVTVGEAVGVNDPSDIPWRTTEWSAGGEDVANA